MTKRWLPPAVAGVGLSLLLVASLVGTSAFQPPAEAVRVDNDDLGGVVNGPRGPEAGVWVIAETTDLPTKFAKIVVTDDRGRYVYRTFRKRPTACGCAATGWSIRRRYRPAPARL